MEAIVADEGQTLLGWRDVPVDNSVLGRLARDVEPVIRQVFIGRGKDTPADMFEWKLYVIRKRLENVVRASDLSEKKYFYIPSLSSRVIIYKGLMLADQVERFYRDLADERYLSALALVHQRYSTNTFPTWDLAHPFRYLAHNGEINTLRGNVNWMHAREGMLASEKYGPDLRKIFPVCTPQASDSAIFDNALELLVLTGRSLPQAMSMLIPEPWAGHESMPDDLKAYYEYQACLIEPWDGPASMAFTDGTLIGGVPRSQRAAAQPLLGHQGGLVVMASEAGVLDMPPEDVESKGRLRPGRMFLVDTAQGRIIADEEIKREFASRHPYRQWLNENQLRLDQLEDAPKSKTNGQHDEPLLKLQRTFGYTLEDLRILMAPMATDGQEPVGSMGNDTPLAVLSDRPQLLYNYFKQLFAQVTNPPLDAIREEIITSMITTIGSEGNLLDETPEQCGLLRLEQPIITNAELAKIKNLDDATAARGTVPFFAGDHRSEGRSESDREKGTVPAEFAAARCRSFSRGRMASTGCAAGCTSCATRLRKAIRDGVTILILSDRGVNRDWVPIPALLATSDVHHHLDPRRDPHALRARRRDGRGPRSAALCPAHGLRRRRGESVPGVGHARQMQAERLFSERRSAQEAAEELHQGGRQGLAQSHVEDGHLDAAKLSRRPDLRGHRAGVVVRRRVFHLDRQPHRRRRPRRQSPRKRSAGTSTPIRAPKCRRRSISTSAANINGAARAKRTCSAPMSSPSCSTPRGSTAARSSTSTAS